ncbi:unnamed protein product [Larinioides sclopetarius]|uniref:Uncharacterized protein n=1 Tax=Larinioides sclopetarius TaxID=280406 RepID=A0AAV1YZL1_9ARAC
MIRLFIHDRQDMELIHNFDFCSFLEYYSGESVCPVRAGLYESNDTKFDIPDMNSFVKWFASGRFWIELKMVGPNSEQLSCLSFKGEARALFSQLNPEIISMYMKNETSV